MNAFSAFLDAKAHYRLRMVQKGHTPSNWKADGETSSSAICLTCRKRATLHIWADATGKRFYNGSGEVLASYCTSFEREHDDAEAILNREGME